MLGKLSLISLFFFFFFLHMKNLFNMCEINLNKSLKCPDHQNKLNLGLFFLVTSIFHLPVCIAMPGSERSVFLVPVT